MKDISTVSMTATVAEAFEERTSKAGRTYFIGGLSFLPDRAEEATALRAFSFSNFPFRDGFPVEGDRVLVAGRLSPEREGGLGLVVDSVQVIGEGELPEEEVVEDDLTF